jgi:hypothetical protein
MPTRIVFDSSREILVAEDEDDVVSAIRRDVPNPVKLESTTGRRMHVNWEHVLFVEDEPLAAE